MLMENWFFQDFCDICRELSVFWDSHGWDALGLGAVSFMVFVKKGRNCFTKEVVFTFVVKSFAAGRKNG